MSNGVKVTGIIVGVLAVIFSYNFINTYVYPFQKQNPNFSDVEKAFAKLQFPTEWQEISSSENRGLHGRGCKPIDNSGCFHKSKTFKLPQVVDINAVQKVISDAGLCDGFVVSKPLYEGQQNPTNNYDCGIGQGLNLGGTYKGPEGEVSITVKTY